MRCACIDIGSNTTRLLVAEPSRGGRLREVRAERAFTRLGSLLGPEGAIPPAVVRVGAEVVAEQIAIALEEGAESIRVVATAAIREAANRTDFVAEVRELAGVVVDVLTGEEEARLAFLGATGSLARCPDGLIGVVDVGGRSSELVAGTREGGVAWATSLPVGSGLLADRHLQDDPPTPAQLDAVRVHVAGVFAPLRPPHPVAAYAVGGSATSLRRLLGTVLDRDALGRGLLALAALPRAEIARRFALHPERARLLPAAILLLEGATEAFGAPLRTCGGGLREGVLLEALRASGRSQVAEGED
ncbi:MAG: exopolyphosphatase / guanosine-5-triphosphate,3-diphosphate pyrophosphatase [Solirubrobacteraceae bacterium]|nr:exopolyphosphatase / guanosine-5-triphosphate,3-diphosphate pyrophosphatase [Solirubrobacteraceae bacterium]